MSNAAVMPPPAPSVPQADREDQRIWRERIEAAEGDPARKQAALSWLSSFAYVAGQQWVVVDRHTRQLRDLGEIDERYADVDLVVADIIMERRGAALGELEQDSDRPEFLAPGDADQDVEEESVQAQVNRALGHAWEFESDADASISEAYQYVVDLGVAAIRCRMDKTAGPPVKASDGKPVEAPIDIATGKPIVKASDAHDYVAGKLQAGEQAKFTPLNEGRITLEAGTAFNLLPPPGVPHEKKFPWEVWVRPVPIDDVHAEYPNTQGLTPDVDIGSIVGTTWKGGNLKDHVWLYTCYERPTRKHPKGRVAVLVGAQKRLLETRPELPYQTVDGEWCSGIVYLHWWRLTDKFWSKGLVESLKESQRLINRTETQTQDIIDRSYPFMLIEEGSMPERPSGRPMEWRELKKGTTVQPQAIPGVPPGTWMHDRIEHLRENADSASTISGLKLGENPANVNTYSQLATLNEQEAGKRSSIRAGLQRSRAKIAELMLLDIERYWPESKQILVAGGKQDELQAMEFSKSVIPAMYVVRPAKGSAKPRGQGAQLQMIEDLANYAQLVGATATNPLAWVQWKKDAMGAGEPLPIPSPPPDHQAEKAEWENHQMFNGDQPAVAYHDILSLHLATHSAAQDIAIMAGDVETLTRIEMHIKEHQQVSVQNAIQVAQQQPAPIQPGLHPGPPGAPGAGGSSSPQPAPTAQPPAAPGGPPPPLAPPG